MRRNIHRQERQERKVLFRVETPGESFHIRIQERLKSIYAVGILYM